MTMLPLKAQVKNGRLVLDEPTDLPEGEVIELVPLVEVLAGRGDDFDDEERAALHARVDTLAMSPVGRILYIVSTEAGTRLRIISARRATAHERRIYADQT